jgi:hypothetical protein
LTYWRLLIPCFITICCLGTNDGFAPEAVGHPENTPRRGVGVALHRRPHPYASGRSTKTNLNGYAGKESVEDGSREVVRVAPLSQKGPTGTFTRWKNTTIRR